MFSRRPGWAVAAAGSTLFIVACVGSDAATVTVAGDAGGVESGAPDAPLGTDSAVDAADATVIDASVPRCDPKKPFGAPVLVSGLSTSDDDASARLSADELTVFFARGVAGSGAPDIYAATRASRDAGWGAPELVRGVNTTRCRSVRSVS